ncbi:hypothetical protein CYMTET_47768 [Cymbomonas tetramitiformis]|uniref:F-box/LRR-repeat protein 15-like leucin rich repeat domain-containing protein n=1 Tax=Cymbomonas tetramitiformis TaxID=36881 RepID=A0AAE0BV26_9CHLO|nr:hypothetical protein CYMTET_47768 [Cymbomonas tetramitiformis]|eukprot:gene3244-4094_t
MPILLSPPTNGLASLPDSAVDTILQNLQESPDGVPDCGALATLLAVAKENTFQKNVVKCELGKCLMSLPRTRRKAGWAERVLQNLRACPKMIRELDLERVPCMGDENFTLEGLEHFIHLRKLNISGHVYMRETELEHLKGLTNLTSLNLAYCSNIGDGGLGLLTHLRQLQSIVLKGTIITDNGPARLKELPNLTSINLHACRRITDAGLDGLKQLSKLTTVDLSCCSCEGGPELTDDGLEHLKGLANLTSINLRKCCAITDDGLVHLGDISNMTFINLGGCFRITDDGLKHLTRLENLTAIHLGRCNQITDDGLNHLMRLENLKDVRLLGCNRITQDGISRLQANSVKVYPSELQS